MESKNLCPEYTGAGVCVDVVRRENDGRIQFIFELGLPRQEHGRWTARSAPFGPRLSDPGTAGFLARWGFTKESLRTPSGTLSWGALIGKPATVRVEHRTLSSGEPYARVTEVGPANGVLVAPSGTYIRECDREAKIVRVEGMRGPAIPSEWDIKIESVEGLNNVPFVSLPPDILHELAKNWLPEVQVKAKPRAAEKRLQLALELWIRQNDSSTP